MLSHLTAWVRLCQVGVEELLRGRVEFGQVWCVARNRADFSSGVLLHLGEDGAHVLREDFAELDAPLVETVDVVEEALDGDAVLVQREQLAAGVGRERALEEDAQRWSISGEELVSVERLGDTLGRELLVGLAERERIRLCEEVRHQLVVVAHDFVVGVDRSLGLRKSDELGCDHTPLMHQLVEAVLAVSPWLAENDRARVDTLVETNAVLRARLAVALHVELLDVRWEAQECLAVRQNGARFYPANVRVVKADKAEHRDRALCQVIALAE